ncbi:transcription factor doublesex isoform X2 [Nomia melanderi]|uniref:transcription factor doublesex isoform X2 n=1 Tax=Nomia melanderi TaxID=2448451 RepID=UPI003FCDAFCA
MENGDETLSTRSETNASSSSTTTTTTSTRTPPKCARCRNHQLIINVKDHKRYCKYRYCICENCKLTAERQCVMARQTAQKRALAQDEVKVRAVGEVDPSPFGMEGDRLPPASQSAKALEGSYDSSSGGSPVSNHSTNGVHTNVGGFISIPTSRKLPSLQAHTGSTAHLPQSPSDESVEILLAYSTKLLELFQYPWVSLPLIYVILKDASGNLEEAVRRIVEANNDIRTMHFWKEVRMIQSGRTYCCPGYATGPTGAPTYEGQVPYIGLAPPPSSVHIDYRPVGEVKRLEEQVESKEKRRRVRSKRGGPVGGNGE